MGACFHAAFGQINASQVFRSDVTKDCDYIVSLATQSLVSCRKYTQKLTQVELQDTIPLGETRTILPRALASPSKGTRNPNITAPEVLPLNRKKYIIATLDLRRCHCMTTWGL